ncbi:MAG: putative O-glycosylation ligase, exosortase A system-associated [Acetobacteraceae bacterium]|jgi:probable O-glycosylation ligase (exosortase A-associated)
MRDIVLVLATLFYLPASLMAPAAGLLCWEWFSIMAPHQEVYGFARGQPFDFVIAAATLLGWLFSSERKRFTPDALPWVLLIWFLWMTVTTIAGPVPDIAWTYWDRVMRILVPVFLSFVLLTNRARIHGMVWTLVIAIGFYGVKNGGYMLAGGSGVLYGPPSSMIADNNTLALAVVMELPLVYYLWKHTRVAWLRAGLVATIPLQIVMVIGSHSRGGVIALGIMLGTFWLRTDRKILYGVIGAAMVAAAFAIMPDVIWERLNTLHNVQGDASFNERVMAWMVALDCARDYFPFGAGFYTPQVATIWHHYLPDVDFHAAHSIYFQVLGEHGYIGLAIYAFVLVLPLYNATIVVRRTRNNPDMAWAYDLADMVRVALVAFYVGAAALSLAYFDGYLVLAALTSTLRELVSPKRVTAAEQRRIALAATRGPVASVGVGGTRGQWPGRYPDRRRPSAYGRRSGPST